MAQPRPKSPDVADLHARVAEAEAEHRAAEEDLCDLRREESQLVAVLPRLRTIMSDWQTDVSRGR